jgi:DNA-binding MarR family transcriptional regulator
MQVSPPSVAGGKEGVGELVGTARQSDTIGVIELELLKLVRHLETFGRRSSPHLDVDRAGYLALRTLESIGPLSTKALADTLHLDASTVTRQIAALEDSGLVERRPDPQDRRSSTIELTPRGRRTMEGVEGVRRERMETLVRHWSEEERVTLGSTLHRLNVALLEYGGMSDGLRETLSYGCPGT